MLDPDDRLPNKIYDGVRYEKSKKLGKEIRDAIASKRKANKENDEAKIAVKKARSTYLVDSKKFDASATESELAQELTAADLGTEETHRILQCKIK